MVTYALPILFTLVLWWVSTVAILYLDGLPPRTFVWSLAGVSLLMILALWGAQVTSPETNVASAYWAFTCGLTAWGWQITTFYMGAITGPRTSACDPHCTGVSRFFAAVQTCLYHELSIIIMAAALMGLTLGQPNQFALWTYIVLWWMHTSAKLNVFLGVPNLGAELVPPHMRYLVSFMKRSGMNLFFPLSVTASTICAVHLIDKASAPTNTSFETIGYTMLATLMGLAILEHWFLVIPLNVNSLWKWGIKPERAEVQTTSDKSLKTSAWSEASSHESDFPAPLKRESAMMDNAIMDTWSAAPPSLCDHAVLSSLLESIRTGAFGEINTVKGVVKTTSHWLQFEVDAHRAKIAQFAPAQKIDPLVIALGRRMDFVRLQAAFDACAVGGTGS